MREARTVVITGASAGVGRAAASAFGAHGWNVGLIARGPDRLAAAAEEVRDAGGTPLVLPADVSDAAAVDAAAWQAVDTFGGIDVWVNVAMVTVIAPVEKMTAEEFRRVTEVTYLGQVNGTLAALRHMRPRNRGTIVQVGSALAYRAIPLQSAYCAAKFAIRGFTDSLRSELAHDRCGIRLTVVHLPAINTPQFEWARVKVPRRPQPLPPIYQPEAAAAAIYRAALEAPRELWVGRSTLGAILANFAAPMLMDRQMAALGYDGQMTDDPVSSDRPDNLFEPPAGDYGTHGRFDRRAAPRAVALPAAAARAGVLLLAATAFAAGLGLAYAGGRRRRDPAGDGSRHTRPSPALPRLRRAASRAATDRTR